MEDKVFVTGVGIISALGVGKDATLQALLKGESCIGSATYIQTEHKEFPVGEVSLSNAEMSRMLNVGYPIDGLRTVLMGIIASKEAVSSAALTTEDIHRAAFINGTTVGGMDKTERHFKKVFDTNAETSESLELKYNDCGYSTELIADNIGKFGMVTTTSTACSSSANAIILGANLIRSGVVDIAVVGGTEALTRFHLNGFNTLMILDREICRPFDKERGGINLGEGAAYIVLENEKSARMRGVDILGVLCGFANTCDAFHQTATSENGEGAYLAMRKAMEMAKLDLFEIDYINAHGTGTPNNDETELSAMKRIWGDNIPRFSSTKSFTGHTTSASGAIETVICLLSMQNGFVPKNLGWHTSIKDDIIPVIEDIENIDIKHVINNSFGFGGNDSTLIFEAF